jgi:hypothetical protein
MLFVQTSAPTGWTKSTTHDNKALRVVSGTAGSGGTTGFTSVFTARTITTANMPSHTHTVTDPGHYHGPYGDAYFGLTYTPSYIAATGGYTPCLFMTTGSARTASATTGITNGNTGGDTAMDFAVQYVDAIIAVKA